MAASFLLGLLLLAAAPAAQPGAELEQFFVGRTEGVSTVHVMMSGRHGVRDRGRGRIDRNGVLILEQVVEEEGKPARNRTWHLARAGPRALAGTISDARGPVIGDLSGNVLHLRYRSAEGPSVEQWITLQPGGRSATNRMVFKRFGVRVATLEGVIRRID